MADKKNTQSILENIRKKIQKFDQPRKVDSGLATSSMGDEFEYIASGNASKTHVSDSAAGAKDTPISSVKQSDEHAALEKELDDSFSDFLNKTTDQKVEEAMMSAKSAPGTAIKDDLNFSVFEEAANPAPINNVPPKVEETKDDQRLNFDVLDEHKDLPAVAEPPVVAPVDAPKTAENKNVGAEEFHIEIETPHDDASASKTAMDSLFSMPATPAQKEDDFLKPKIDDNFAVVDKNDKNSVSLNNLQPIEKENKTFTATPLNNSIHKEENDDFLKIEEDDSRQIKVSSEEMSKVNDISNFLNEKKVEITPEAPKNKSAASSLQTLDALDSILNEKTTEQVTSSLKKLAEAKSSASDIASLTKSDKFNDVATQLLEQKLEKWLNDNLPDLVEKIVREEIKKIIH